MLNYVERGGFPESEGACGAPSRMECSSSCYNVPRTLGFMLKVRVPFDTSMCSTKVREKTKRQPFVR